MLTASPLQLYVHIPFCMHKCHYCDFNSHERSQPDWAGYQQALVRELQYWAEMEQCSGRILDTVFFGGGTPSLAPPELIDAVLTAARDCCGIDAGAEITLEANPGTADADHFRGYRQAGINRLSMGVQSLDAAELQWLERIHSADEVVAAYDMARAAGFDNINLDLMYGLPGQQLQGWLNSLHAVIAMAPEHMSCYQLTVEPHTKLAATHARKPYALPDDDAALDMFYATRAQLAVAGYQAYEISNFSRPGLRCRHNDGYWLYHDYIGIGAGAAGKWDQADRGVMRYSNIRTPERYIAAARSAGCAINSDELLNREQAAAEACWLGLRRSRGVNRAAFAARFEQDPWRCFHNDLQPWVGRQMLSVSDTELCLTEQGLAMADELAACVL